MENSSAMTPGTITKLSDAIANPLIKVYKAGQLGLVFIFVGLLAITFSQFNRGGKYDIVLFILGITLIFVSFLLFLFLQLKNPLAKVKNMKKEKEIVDSLQELSINLTIMAEKSQSFVFKYINQIDSFLKAGLPIIQKLPLVPDKIKRYGIEIQDIQESVVEIVQTSEHTIKEVHEALVKSDIKKFKKYAQEIARINTYISLNLKK
ncbi:MAG: hypothetical protein JST68_17355 [Bacteroidetes bacterium]|nr:hypothetical protein [Bacteroidota bacterium]